MKKLIAALALILSSCAPSAAYAADSSVAFTITNAHVSVTGFRTACIADIDFSLLLMARMNKLPIERLQGAQVTSQGETFGGCWMPSTVPGQVYILDERGGFGFLDLGTPA
jgi:hypothetical protein